MKHSNNISCDLGNALPFTWNSGQIGFLGQSETSAVTYSWHPADLKNGVRILLGALVRWSIAQRTDFVNLTNKKNDKHTHHSAFQKGDQSGNGLRYSEVDHNTRLLHIKKQT